MLRRIPALLCITSALVLPAASRADAFHVYNFGTDNSSNILGINDAGEVLVDRPFGFRDLYLIYQEGKVVYDAKVLPPSFVDDNGTPCSAPALSGGRRSIGQPMCNGGREVYGLLNRNSPFARPYEMFPGSGPLGQGLASAGTISELVLNPNGDFAYVDAENGTLREVVATTPEPSSLLLLATGLTGVLAVGRRRFGTSRLDG